MVSLKTLQPAAPLLLAALLLCAATAPAAGAAKWTKPVALEGSALLVTWYDGVLDVLVNRSTVIPGETLFNGLSGGAVTSTLTAAGILPTTQKQFWKEMIGECGMRFGEGCVGYINPLMVNLLEKYLPDDVHKLVSGKVRVALSQLSGSNTTLQDSASWIISSWKSKMDVISCLRSTDYIPCFAGLTTYTVYRDQPIIDGGYANGFEELCPKGDTANCLKLASWVLGDYADTTGCPPYNATHDRTDRVKKLYKNPKWSSDWLLETIKESCPITKWGGDPTQHGPLNPKFVPQNSTTPDLYPGKYGKLLDFNGSPVTSCVWQGWSMRIAKGMEMETMEHIFKQGQYDATLWCEANKEFCN